MAALPDDGFRDLDEEHRARRCREVLNAPGGDKWLGERIVAAMRRDDLSLAGELAAILAQHTRGSEWYPHAGGPRPAALRDARLSVPKLRHDIRQFRHLRGIGAVDERLDGVIEAYESVLRRLSGTGLGNNARVPMTHDDERRIGHVYGRIVHMASAPRLGRALSPGWDRERAESRYLESRAGIVVIDDFLTAAALDILNRFCLESTVWSGNRYADGRLGSFFFAGFNCPLLLQVAEEIRGAMPRVIGERHPLAQLWAFKNTSFLPPDSTIHADFAAVNVNFWITPESANTDEASGGMVIYDIDAPSTWDFATYNERIDIIREYLSRRGHGTIRVPYRQNRAVIFNSDLFHATEAVRFRPEYACHRINVTMLYGDRALDRHRPPAPDSAQAAGSASWRSAAFCRARR